MLHIQIGIFTMKYIEIENEPMSALLSLQYQSGLDGRNVQLRAVKVSFSGREDSSTGQLNFNLFSYFRRVDVQLILIDLKSRMGRKKCPHVETMEKRMCAGQVSL